MAKIFKPVPFGNGSLFTYRAYDQNGGVVEEGKQTFNSAADVEKYLRATVTGEDRIEVEGINNVNKDSNANVNLVDKTAVEDRFHGMTPVQESVEKTGEQIAEESAPSKKGSEKKPASKKHGK